MEKNPPAGETMPGIFWFRLLGLSFRVQGLGRMPKHSLAGVTLHSNFCPWKFLLLILTCAAHTMLLPDEEEDL
jgi:hypothetical protein